jgi:hypothetical protein
VRTELLDSQIHTLIQRIELPKDWAQVFAQEP